MLLSSSLTTRLLGAIDGDSLVFLCGAGLSIPEPASLLSAVEVCRRCYDRWLLYEPSLDPKLRENVERLAAHFHSRGDFDRFIKLVPWEDLVGPPNSGHAAIADLLISRAAHAALSTNFDPLIERWGEDRKVDLRGALNGQEAIEFSTAANPLLKIHGCSVRQRRQTLWTQEQLSEAEPLIRSS
jgi:hypothetical protein